MILGEYRAQFLFHIREQILQPSGVQRALDRKGGAQRVVFQIRRQQADRGSDAGMRRDQHKAHIQHARHFGGMQRPGPAKPAQGKVARVDALLHGPRPDRVGHIGIEHRERAFGGLIGGAAQCGGQFADDACRGIHVQRHLPAQKVVRHQTTKNQIGICHRRQVAPPSISGRAGIGARTFGADTEGVPTVQIGDGPAPSPDGVNVDHRQHDWETRNTGTTGIRLGQAAVTDDADIGACPANIKRDEAVRPGMGADPGPAPHTRDKAR